MIPQLSIQERDRRYKIVRAEMAKRGKEAMAKMGQQTKKGGAG